MQIFFNLSYSGIDSNKWSQKKFYKNVTEFLNTLEGVQFKSLKETCGWNAYLCLIPVKDKEEALKLRKEVENRCKTVNSKCRPYYFRFRNKNVDSINKLSMFGLTTEESILHREKAPPGVYREIQV